MCAVQTVLRGWQLAYFIKLKKRNMKHGELDREECEEADEIIYM